METEVKDLIDIGSKVYSPSGVHKIAVITSKTVILENDDRVYIEDLYVNESGYLEVSH